MDNLKETALKQLKNNSSFNKLNLCDQESLLRTAILNHYTRNNEHQHVDGNECTTRVTIRNISFKTFVMRVKSVFSNKFDFQIKDIKTTGVVLSVSAKTALKATRQQLNKLCDLYLTPVFDELIAEKKQQEIEERLAKEIAMKQMQESNKKDEVEERVVPDNWEDLL